MVYNLFRRYQQAIMIAVTLITIITFAGFYSHSDFLDKSGANKVGVIYGRNVSLVQVQKANRKGDLCRQLAQEEMFQPKRPMADLYESLAVNQQDAKENFIWNSMVLKHEANILGIAPTQDEIFETIKSIPTFQTNGTFDSNRYAMFAQNFLPHLGFTTDDLEDLIGDALRLQKIKSLLGATIAPSQNEIRETFTRFYQKTQASVIRFKLADFLASTQVSDEDVKKLYEERKGSLKTDELRKVKYVAFVLPTTDKPLEGTARAEALTKLQKDAEDFSVAMTDKSTKFEDAATKAGVKVQETQDFSIAKPPAELEGSGDIATAAFKLTEQQPNSDVLETARGYYVLQLAKIEQPRQLTFEEAKANLADTLKHDRALEALNLKATDVRNKIETDLKAGKSFADATTAAGMKPEEIPPFSPMDQGNDQSVPREVKQTAFDLNEGQLSTVVPGSEGSSILYVSKRLPIDEKQFESEKKRVTDQIATGERFALFQQWLKLRRAAAQLQSSFHG